MAKTLLGRGVNQYLRYRKLERRNTMFSLAEFSILLLCLCCTLQLHNIYLQNGFSPVYVASQNGHTQIVDILVKAGADINLTTKKVNITVYTVSVPVQIAVENICTLDTVYLLHFINPYGACEARVMVYLFVFPH